MKKTFLILLLFIPVFLFPCEIENHFSFYVFSPDYPRGHILYSGCYDAINLGPHIIRYRLTAEMVNNSEGGRPNVTFTLDRDGGYLQKTLLEHGFRLPTHASFTNTGFDRGHMAPNEDFNSTRANAIMTFFIGNIWPQTPTINRGIWSQLEAQTRSLAEEREEVLVVIIVEEFRRERLPNGVSIPSAFERRVFCTDGELILHGFVYQ